MLYIAAEASIAIYLLFIRHYRQLSFNFSGLWRLGEDANVRSVPASGLDVVALSISQAPIC